MRKFSFLLGVGVGYFFGTRAGRQQFERIKSTGRAVWEDPRVQSGVHKVGQVAREQAAAVTDKVADVVKSRIHSSASSADEAQPRPTPPQPGI